MRYEDEGFIYRDLNARATEMYWELREQRDIVATLRDEYEEAKEKLEELEWYAEELQYDMNEYGMENYYDFELPDER